MVPDTRSISRAMRAQIDAANKKAAQQTKLAEEQKKLMQSMVERGPGYRAVTELSAQERAAGVTPVGFEGIRDRKTGELLQQFKLDPYQGRASQALSEQAFAQGESPWLKMQKEKLALQQGQAVDQAAKSQAQAMAQAQSQLMRQGGLGGGARARMAMQTARDAALAQQQVRARGMEQGLGLEESDLNRKQDLLGRFAQSEQQAQQQNVGQLIGDVGRSTEFDMKRYGEQMAAYGAQQTAAAQRAAAGGGGKCFHPDTLIKLKNGSLKKISEIKKGDTLFIGGEVLDTHEFKVDNERMFYYNGVYLTGSHAVLEDEKWVRVEASRKKSYSDIYCNTVYNLTTELHLIYIKDNIFSDNVETKEDYKDERISLSALNGEC